MAEQNDTKPFELIHNVCREANVDPVIVFAALLDTLASTHTLFAGAIGGNKPTAFDDIRSQMGLLKQIGLTTVDEPPASVLEAINMFVKVKLFMAKANKAPQAEMYAACGTILNRYTNATSHQGIQYGINFDQMLKDDKGPKITLLPTHDEAFENWCEQVKASEQPIAVFESPQQLGDTYDQIVAKLNRLKAHKLPVFFASSEDSDNTSNDD